MGKSKRRCVSLNDETWDVIIPEIKAYKGLSSHTAVIQQCVLEVYLKLMRSNIERTSLPKVTERKEPTVKPKAGVTDKNVICGKLGGKIKNIGGALICEYYTYTYKQRYKQQVELGALTEELVGLQYHPSREKVEALQAQGKTEYGSTDIS